VQNNEHHIHRLPRAVLALGAAGTLALLAACGSASTVAPAAASSSAGSSGAAAAPASAAAGSSAAASSYPTQDVVSAIAVDPNLRQELPAAVQSSGKLRLGTTIAPGINGLPHAGTAPDGTQVGVDVDLRNAIAKVLGFTWDVQNGTFATIIPGVQNGKYDVGQDNFGVTKAREQVVDFATYLTDGQAFLAPAAGKLDKVTDITDVCGLNIGTPPGSTFQQILTAAAPKCQAAGKPAFNVQYFADTAPIFLGLANGKLDAYFGPTLSLQYDAIHVPNTKFLGQVSSTTVGFVTGKGSPLARPLSDAVNKLIASGDYAKILAKWGVESSSGITKAEVNPVATL
jgi:polar amino acid transport system substrate-binding protein